MPDVRALLMELRDGYVESIFGPKDTVFAQGEPADAVFYILQGTVQVSVLSEQGKEGVIAVLKAGEFFGEGCLAGQPTRTTSAVAVGHADIVMIKKATMLRVLRERTTFAQIFTMFLLARNIEIESDLVDQLFNSIERRLARTLLLLTNFGVDGRGDQVIPTINQDFLAARVGTTRSSINFFMNKFRKLGFIEYDKELTVHASLLDVIVEDPIPAPKSRRALGKRSRSIKKLPTSK